MNSKIVHVLRKRICVVTALGLHYMIINKLNSVLNCKENVLLALLKRYTSLKLEDRYGATNRTEM